MLREYIWLEQEPLALREYELRPGLYFYINDHLGTPQQLVDSQGTVVWQAAYLPFGEAQLRVGTVRNNLRFPGQYFDAETGLHYNWNRYYDPVTGRYISPDPIGLDGGMNLYAYVGNDPVNWVDPEGLSALGGVLTGLGADLATPEPSDLAWPKWAGWGAAIGGAALLDWMMNESDEQCEDPLDDYPADPDQWTPPDGWVETPAGEKTGGRHRQWKGPNGEIRRWDKEGREGGKERGPHWHDPRKPGTHIDPTR